MADLVYPRERTLGTITLVLGLIAWLRGTGVRLSDEQFPDLYAQYLGCCKKLGMDKPPEAYILQGDGMMNAFATRFLGRNFVIVLTANLDAMREQPDGINFYFGHELGHIKQGHLTGHFWRMPVLWLPLIGAAYARAQEYTCDLHGKACCDDPQSAAQALAVLAAGSEKWKRINLVGYARQTLSNRGFFADLHELLSGYPWLTKRVARMLKADVKMPGRNGFSYLFALLVPYGGRAGGGFAGLIVVIAIVGVVAALAIPALKAAKDGSMGGMQLSGIKDFQAREEFNKSWRAATKTRDALSGYYQARQDVPDELADAGITESQAAGLQYDNNNMTLTAQTTHGPLIMTPSKDEAGKVVWHCSTLPAAEQYLPIACRAEE